MPAMSDAERLAVLETEMRTVQSDIAEIKGGVKHLSDVAARGGGAFHAILMIGGLIGWVVGVGMALYSLVHR